MLVILKKILGNVLSYLIYRFLLISLVPIFSYSINLNNHLELSYIGTSGNTNVSTFSTKLQTSLIFKKTEELKFKFNTLKSRSNKLISANQYDIKFEYNHMFTDNFFSYIGANYTQDKLSDYKYRFNLGPGFGYKILNSNSNIFSIQTGLDYSFDRYIKNTYSEYLASRTELNYKYIIDNNLQINQILSYLVSLNNNNVYFINSETSLSVRIINDISLGVSYKIDYTNYTKKVHTNKKFLTSIIIDF